MSEPTSSFRVGTTPVAVVGAACRLPGAPNEHEFWKVLSDGRCTVGPLPEGRWRVLSAEERQGLIDPRSA